MELQTVLEQRYSCRNFSPEAPTREQIDAILKAGRLAPTARNLQPQRVWVVTKDEDLHKIDACTPCRYGAPVVFIIGYDNKTAKIHTQAAEPWSYGSIDTASALIHMLLKATDLGLATCWVGMYEDALLLENFPLPKSFEVRALVMLGTPNEKGSPGPFHTERLPLEKTVTWL